MGSPLLWADCPYAELIDGTKDGYAYFDDLLGTYVQATNVAASATAIDADFFASAVDMKTTAAGWTECTFESGVYLTSMINTTLWANLGLTGQPNGYIDICFTNTSTTSGAPILAMRVDYEMPS